MLTSFNVVKQLSNNERVWLRHTSQTKGCQRHQATQSPRAILGDSPSKPYQSCILKMPNTKQWGSLRHLHISPNTAWSGIRSSVDWQRDSVRCFAQETLAHDTAWQECQVEHGCSQWPGNCCSQLLTSRDRCCGFLVALRVLPGRLVRVERGMQAFAHAVVGGAHAFGRRLPLGLQNVGHVNVAATEAKGAIGLCREYPQAL